MRENVILSGTGRPGHTVVIGAGVMGAGIAAVLVNSGWHVDLLEQVPDGAGSDTASRNRLAQEGLDRAKTSRPPHFGLPELAAKVRIGNMEDHARCMANADWIVEAAAEDPAVKREIFKIIATNAGPHTIVSSNTSGLSLAGIVAECPADLQERFLGTHFFNPPRWMRPLELIPIQATSREVFLRFSEFAEVVLGKRVVIAKDTPGFISTRLGMYALVKAINIAIECGITVEEADYLTGPLTGRPKSGIFRLADVIGLDITARIIDNLRTALPDDAYYQALHVPDLMRKLIADGKVGVKSGEGFTRKTSSGLELIDLMTGEYRPRTEPDRMADEISKLDLKERIPALYFLESSHYSVFLRRFFDETLGYMADIAPIVADRIVEIDDAIMGGFGWELGPFHQLDVIGSAYRPSRSIAALEQVQSSADKRFYTHSAGVHYYFDLKSGSMSELPHRPGVISLKDLARAGKTIREWPNASLIDIGDGVACFEWHTKMNTFSLELAEALDDAQKLAERQCKALVLGGSGANFSAGFDLARIAEWIEAGEFELMDRVFGRFQQVLQGVKYSKIPVVAAIYGYTLGGGCEISLHCSSVQAAFEANLALPESKVGLLPVGGGVTQMLLRSIRESEDRPGVVSTDTVPAMIQAWRTILSGAIGGCALDARKSGLLLHADRISMNRDRLLFDAKEHALSLADCYVPPTPDRAVLPGASGFARFQMEVHQSLRSGQMSQFDAKVALAVASIFSGGNLKSQAEVSEQYILDVEREAFLSLASTPEALARIRHMLATGKPLKN
ncbi:MAG: 3-hydroxyacyl-CoA dehydrogenase/enoyl-CoA hydratase family protein [Chthonomonadales bacterium]